MFFWNKICGFIAILFTISLAATGQSVISSASYANKESKKILFTDSTFLLTKLKVKQADRSYAVIPQNYYAQNLGLICKKELALEKVTKVPFRFRLGSLQQCNYQEGKRY